MNKQLISQAVVRRLAEVCGRVNQMDSHAFGEMGLFVTSVKEVLRAKPDRISKLTRFPPPESWASAYTDCLTSLRALSLPGPKAIRSEPQPEHDRFFNQLKMIHAAREPVFALLAERYAWPLNFSLDEEGEVREYVLMRLMTTCRTRIENESIAAVNLDDLLLELNLIGVHASATTDLRFLDALNYYYELLPATIFPESQHGWLLVSWYALYARALNSWS